MNDMKINPSGLPSHPTGNYYDAMRLLGLRGSFTSGLGPLGGATAVLRFAGRATTGRFLPSRGRRPAGVSMYDLIETAGSGGVLVAQAPYPWAAMGSIMFTYAKRVGLAGVVLDGYVRDAAEICELGLPVLCRGVSMNASAEYELRAGGEALDCAGALVMPGDLVVADGDGAVFIAPEDLAEVLRAVRHVASVEEAVLPLVRSGAAAKAVAAALGAKRTPPGSRPPERSAADGDGDRGR